MLMGVGLILALMSYPLDPRISCYCMKLNSKLVRCTWHRIRYEKKQLSKSKAAYGYLI
jgi:hypothetical protein